MSISNSLTEDDHAARRGDFVFAAALPRAGGNVSLLRSRTRRQHRDFFSAPGVEASAPVRRGFFMRDRPRSCVASLDPFRGSPVA
jgi:hypothetical protein